MDFSLNTDLFFHNSYDTFYKYQQKYLADVTSFQLFMSISLVLAMHEFFYFAKVARPEMLVTMLGFLSFYLLKKYLSTGKYWLICLAGFAAGLAMLAHLNGVIFVASGFIFLFFPLNGNEPLEFSWKGFLRRILDRRKIFASLLFLAAAIVAFSPYLLDVLWHFDIFKIQMFSPLVIPKTSFTLLKPLINLSREHQRLFRRPEIIIPSVLFFFHLITNRKKIFNSEVRDLTIYTLLLMVFLGLVVEEKTIKYSTYLIPFWGILISQSIATMDTKRKVMVSLNTIFLILLFTAGLYWQGKSVFEKEEYSQFNKSIADKIPQNSTCVAPMNFIFNEIEHYKILSDYMVGYEGFGNITIKSMLEFCRKNQCEYVVFNKYYDRWEYLHDYNEIDSLLAHFEIIAVTNDFVVLKYKDKFPEKNSSANNYADESTVQSYKDDLRRYVSFMAQRAREDERDVNLP